MKSDVQKLDSVFRRLNAKTTRLHKADPHSVEAFEAFKLALIALGALKFAEHLERGDTVDDFINDYLREV